MNRSVSLVSNYIVLALSATAMVIILAIALTAPAHAAIIAPEETPEHTWNTNGTVFDTELSDDGKTLYIGGKFTRVRENPPGVAGRSFPANSVAAIDVESGEAIGGWNPNVTGGTATVRALELSKDGTTLYVGGNFTSLGGQPRQNLAAVDAANGSVEPFAPKVTLNGDPTTPIVYKILAGGGRLYAGGVFNNVDGKTRPKLAAFSLTTGVLDPGWRPKVSGHNVRELEFDGAKSSIFVAGRFRSVTGSDGVSGYRESVARVYTSTGNLHPWAIPPGRVGDPQVGFDLTVTPTRLYGGFGLGPNFLAAYRLDNGNTGSRVWQFNTVGNVQTVELSADGSRLFFGGHFGTNEVDQRVCGDRYLSGLASVNPATGAIYCDWIPRLAPSNGNGNGAWDMSTTGGALWVGGGFTHVSGVAQPNIARFDYGSP